MNPKIHCCPRSLRLSFANFLFASCSLLVGSGIVPVGVFASLAVAQTESSTTTTAETNKTPESDAADEAADKKVTFAEVRELLRELEGDRLAQRDAAEKQLVALGPGVVPFLPEIDARTSGELKIRLERIRQSFENEDVEAFFESSTVTLSGKMDLLDAIESISEQTGNEISLQGEDALSDIEIELDVQDEPFWNVLDTVIRQANLRINAFGTTEYDLVLAPGGQNTEGENATFATGPFRVETSFVQATKRFNAQIPGQLQVSLQVTWEPRLQPVFMQIPMASIEATTSEDETLSSTNPQAAPEIPLNYGGCTTQIDLMMERPPRSVDMLKNLKGEFVIAVPGERHRYEFKEFANGARQSQEYGDVRVTLEGARRNGKVYEMRMLIEFGNAQGALDSFRGFILSNQAYLLDKNNQRVENLGLNTYASSNSAVGIAYLFQINDDPNSFTLVYETPSSVSKQTVQFKLSDIELP